MTLSLTLYINCWFPHNIHLAYIFLSDNSDTLNKYYYKYFVFSITLQTTWSHLWIHLFKFEWTRQPMFPMSIPTPSQPSSPLSSLSFIFFIFFKENFHCKLVHLHLRKLIFLFLIIFDHCQFNSNRLFILSLKEIRLTLNQTSSSTLFLIRHDSLCWKD